MRLLAYLAAQPAPPGRTPRRELAAVLALVAAAVCMGIGAYMFLGVVDKSGGTPYENPNPACRPETACTARSDVFLRLLGTRMVLTERESPYRDALLADVGPLLPPDADLSIQRFYYPLPIAFVLAPFAALPFADGGAAFTWAFSLAFGLALLACMLAISRGRCPIALGALLVGVAAYTPAFASAAELQQPSLLFGAALALACLAALFGWWRVLGVLAAVLLLKPQTGVPVVAVLALGMALFDRSRRGLWWLLGTVVVGLAASLAFVPTWIGGFVADVRAYQELAQVNSVLARMGVPGVLVVTLLVGGLLWLGLRLWQDRDEPARAGADLALAACGAAILALLCLDRLSPYYGSYDHLPILIGAGLLVGRAFVARPRWVGVVAGAVPVAAVLIGNELGRWQDGVQAADWVFSHLGELAIPPQLLLPSVVAQLYMQTVAAVLMLGLVFIAAAPRLRRAPAPLRTGGVESEAG